MHDNRGDIPLGFSRTLIAILKILTIVGGAALTLVALFLLLGWGFAEAELLETYPSAAPSRARLWLTMLPCVAIGAVVIFFFFLQRLGEIVGSVAEGNPFIRINAERLRQMGWFALVMQVFSFAIYNLSRLFEHAAGPVAPGLTEGFEIDSGGAIDVGMILLALLLFVLARVFEYGTDMQEELEGTI